MPDARVQAAIDHWASRLITNGVAFNDFQRVTSSLEAWDDWLDAWTAVGDEHRARAEEAAAAGRNVSAAEAYQLAAVCFHFAKFVWVLDTERNKACTRAANECTIAARSLDDPTFERIEVPFEGGPQLVANLRRPAGVDQPPIVVLIPGLDSTKEEFSTLEATFLKRGMATLSMDGPGQGESGFELSIRPDYEAAVSAVIDAVSGRSDIDLDRLGACGVSLGGYYAPRAAAFEKRIQAVIGVSGPYDLSANWDLLPPVTRETIQHHTGASSQEEAYKKAAELSLSGVAEKIDQPALIMTGKLDRLIAWEDTKRIADEAQDATWIVYDDGNHVLSNRPFWHRPVIGDWMAEQLAASLVPSA